MWSAAAMPPLSERRHGRRTPDMLRRTIAGMGTAALLLLFALAPPDRCDSPQTQAEMNRCAGEELRRNDAQLNVAYSRLLKKLDPNRRAKLQKAERAWVAFRDAQCDYEGSESEGGSIQPLEIAACKTELTKARIAQLRE
jgi:uncharacterized protein YecT (DUF1311 family)